MNSLAMKQSLYEMVESLTYSMEQLQRERLSLVNSRRDVAIESDTDHGILQNCCTLLCKTFSKLSCIDATGQGAEN